MANSETSIILLAVKRLDLNELEPSSVISISVREEDKVADVSQIIRSKLQINSSDLILRLRNSRGSIIPLNGKIIIHPNLNSRPFTLEVVKHFQSVEPKPNSLELTQYAESLKNKLLDIQERITNVEASMGNMQEKRKEKVQQEVVKLENTITFLKKRIEEAESIEWRGMFVKNPLW
ncbi:unnamed protein product [Lymnaea stagnalis]|uniref:Uncharacterized protein n=1 Tax=Lymnaea stagnalis TaxID=6523 RepID=A0AAV2HX56_LYMST